MNISIFFRLFCETVIVSYVFLIPFAREIGTRAPEIDPLANAPFLTALLIWARFSENPGNFYGPEAIF